MHPTRDVSTGQSAILTNGVAVGVYGDSGLTLSSGSSFLSEGKPDFHNILVKNQAVQEGTNVWGTNTGAYFGLLQMTHTPATRPDIKMRLPT